MADERVLECLGVVLGRVPVGITCVGPRFAIFALRDGRLIMGQQYSGGAAAKLASEALGV